MLLSTLIKELKEVLKTQGDRELVPYVTVENILEAPEPPAPNGGDQPAADPMGPVRAPRRGRPPAEPKAPHVEPAAGPAPESD